MTISLGMIVGLVVIPFVFGKALGGLLAWALTERGRRRDVMWWAQLDQSPKDLRQGATVTAPKDPEAAAVERAEILQVRGGLKRMAEAEGLTLDEKELQEEAMRLVTQANTELGGG